MEPITALTDAILAAWTALLGALLFVRARGRRAMLLWAGGFAATAASAVAGVGFHAWRTPWLLVPVATAIATFFFGAAAAEAWLRPRARRVAVAVLLLELVACVVAAAMSDSFLVVAIDYVPVLAAVLVLALRRGAPLIAAGVAVSFAAAAVQQSALPAHNDVFHVIQMAAMFLLYRGALTLSTSAPEI